nr:J domain-containing protein [uncultured Sphingomonas sp.]
MSDDEPFIDYYDVLQVTPSCDAKMLEAAFHHFAKLYHPDRPDTSDTGRFHEVNEAYRILRDPEQRIAYDKIYVRNGGDLGKRVGIDGAAADDSGALDDADDHARILMYLYQKRRENAQDAGVVGFYLQNLLQCSDEHFEFHKWYLKEKGYIVLTEQGTLAITIQGIDHVISMSKTAKAEKLLLARRDDAGE